jgi:thioredoxin reductase (NADPH)
MYDVIVIGGASAGLTAAMYASRQALNTLIITKDIGGQALLTNDIENYPAFEHVGGFELMSRFEQQARNFGAEFVYEEVISIQENESRCFTVRTTTDNQYNTSTIILAFGKTPRDLNVPGEKELKGKGGFLLCCL